VAAAPEGLDMLAWRSAPHSNDDASGQDRVRQIAQASECHGGVDGKVLELDRLAPDDAPADNGTKRLFAAK
jgi:hypothetical protein